MSKAGENHQNVIFIQSVSEESEAIFQNYVEFICMTHEQEGYLKWIASLKKEGQESLLEALHAQRMNIKNAGFRARKLVHYTA